MFTAEDIGPVTDFHAKVVALCKNSGLSLGQCVLALGVSMKVIGRAMGKSQDELVDLVDKMRTLPKGDTNA